MARAAYRAGRRRKITLVAVTKTGSFPEIKALVALGAGMWGKTGFRGLA